MKKGLPVFDPGKFRIGLIICFDWIFPEVWRILAGEKICNSLRTQRLCGEP